ncbi:GatB/YqeY domain-containing protein [Thermodesulfobacteriota bacterium]
MQLSERISEDLKKAMKNRDQLLVSCLRMLKAGIKNKRVEKGQDLDDNEIQTLISSQVRKGQEAAKEFRKGGRDDLAEKEEKEINILFTYLPEQLGDDELENILNKIISENSLTGIKDMGMLMKKAMVEIKGKTQGSKVSETAKKLLS